MLGLDYSSSESEEEESSSSVQNNKRKLDDTRDPPTKRAKLANATSRISDTYSAATRPVVNKNAAKHVKQFFSDDRRKFAVDGLRKVNMDSKVRSLGGISLGQGKRKRDKPSSKASNKGGVKDSFFMPRQVRRKTPNIVTEETSKFMSKERVKAFRDKEWKKQTDKASM